MEPGFVVGRRLARGIRKPLPSDRSLLHRTSRAALRVPFHFPRGSPEDVARRGTVGEGTPARREITGERFDSWDLLALRVRGTHDEAIAAVQLHLLDETARSANEVKFLAAGIEEKPEPSFTERANFCLSIVRLYLPCLPCTFLLHCEKPPNHFAKRSPERTKAVPLPPENQNTTFVLVSK